MEALVKQLTEEPYSIHIVEDHYTIASIDLRTQWIIFNAKWAKILVEKKPNWLRAILAHEIAHVKLGHLYAGVASDEEKQELEFEADQEAVNILKNRGHDPWDYWRWMKVLKKAADKNPRGFYEQYYSTHPYSGERLEKIEKMITEIESSSPERLEAKAPSRSESRFLRHLAPRCLDDPQYRREFPILCGQVPRTQVTKRVEQRPRIAKATGPSVKAEKPEWKIGYWWEYAWKRPGRSGTYTEEIIREDTFEGVPVYVTERGRRQYYYTKDALGDIARMSSGRLESKRTPPYQLLSWPLEVGKEWRNTYVREKPQEKSNRTFAFQLVVASLEKVVVPAGTFEAFKIERYRSDSGELSGEYWYSPKVKWFVKQKRYLRDGVRERELISFKVD